ncbi:MAG: hypothetical protein FWC93_01990 [Defluviitaleaceae bacterium]|nr:hypothetical protein [Defluviitaleaceae bacterium]
MVHFGAALGAALTAFTVTTIITFGVQDPGAAAGPLAAGAAFGPAPADAGGRHI